MIPSANRRKKIVVLASSPKKTKIIVIKDLDGKWNIPDSHRHWKIGKKMAVPVQAAAVLLKDSTLGILNSNEILTSFSLHGNKKKLPSGGNIYQCFETLNLPLSSAVNAANRVSQFLKLEYKVEMKDVEEMKLDTSFSKFGSETIEAVRFLG